MKTLNPLFIALLLFCSIGLKAQAPADWTVNPYLYEYSTFTYAGQGVDKIVTASDGSSIVAGTYTDSTLYNFSTNPVAGRVIVQKYSRTGELIAQYVDADPDWVQISGVYPTGLNDVVIDMLIDGDNNVYFIETQSDTVRLGATLYKGIRGIVKLDANMNLIWKEFSPADNWLSMIFDSNGNIIVNGTTKNNGDGTLNNIVTAKYSPDGDLLWSKLFSSEGSFSDFGNDVTADGSGNIYVTGSVGTATVGSSVITMKYDADGNLIWNKTYDYNPSGTGSDQGGSIVASAAGNVYVERVSDIGGGYNRPGILKYDANGNLKWSQNFSTPGAHTQLYPVRIRLNASENVYAGCLRQTFHFGVSFYSDILSSAIIYKYKRTGELRWMIRKDTAQLKDFDVTAGGDVYLTGSYGLNRQMYTAKYNTIAVQQWQDVYLPSILGDQIFSTSGGSCISINPNDADKVVAGGSVVVENSGHVNFTSGVARHFGDALKVDGENPELNEQLSAFPNPANQQVTVGFSLPQQSQASAKIFDLTGKLQEEKGEQTFQSGAQQFILNTSGLPSGIYFCEIKSQGPTHSFTKNIRIIVQH